MNIKKYISVFLSATVATTLLVGCSQKTDNSQNQKPTTTKEISVISPDGLPAMSIAKIAKEKPTIKDGYNVTYSVINTTEAL
ncbi:MAG: ABC transporter substrate-binding protein, partial [Peptostreptococcaceae bacterium]|nr:ABC transporter substrate-binding protein [Peptostreptococcaceae bacterium]